MWLIGLLAISGQARAAPRKLALPRAPSTSFCRSILGESRERAPTGLIAFKKQRSATRCLWSLQVPAVYLPLLRHNRSRFPPGGYELVRGDQSLRAHFC